MNTVLLLVSPSPAPSPGDPSASAAATTGPSLVPPGASTTISTLPHPADTGIGSAPPTVFDWVSLVLNATAAVAAVVALGLAVYAIKVSQRQARDAERTLIRERQIVFEIELLRDLLDRLSEAGQASGSGDHPAIERLFASGALAARLAFFGRDELRLWWCLHNVFGPEVRDESIPAPPDTLWAGEGRLVQHLAQVALYREVRAAIDRRVNESRAAGRTIDARSP